VEIVVEYEILYLGLILMCGKYNYRITLICTCYDGLVVLKFV